MGKKVLYLTNQIDALQLQIAKMQQSGFNYADIDTIGIEYNSAVRDLDLQQNCNKYIWEGLPANIYSWLIEQMLYYRGSLAGFISGGNLFILPYTMSKGINIYGLPNAVTPITYNGTATGGKWDNRFPKELSIDNSGMHNEEGTAVILYDRVPTFGASAGPPARYILNDSLIKFQTNILGRIKINLANSIKKTVFVVENAKQADSLRQDVQSCYGSQDPFLIVRKDQTSVLDNKPLQSGIDLETQALFETWQSINSIRCMISGIDNGGAFEKKERVITSELENDNMQTDLLLDVGLQMRQLFLEQMKIQYPQYVEMLNKITVRINKSAEKTKTEEIETAEVVENE